MSTQTLIYVGGAVNWDSRNPFPGSILVLRHWFTLSVCPSVCVWYAVLQSNPGDNIWRVR